MYSHCDLYGGSGCDDGGSVGIVAVIVVLLVVFLVWNRKKLTSGEKSEFYKIIFVLVGIAALALLGAAIGGLVA